MKIQGVFKGLTNANGLKIKIKISGNTFKSTSKIKANKFSLKIPNLNTDLLSKKPLEVVVVDNNGDKANFRHKDKRFDLDPQTQYFEFEINSNRKKAKVKLRPRLTNIAVLATEASADIESVGAEDVNPPLSVQLKRYGQEDYEQARLYRQAGRNKPKKDPEQYILTGPSVPQEWRDDVLELHTILNSVIGGYDNYVLASYDKEDDNSAIFEKLELLGYWYNNNGEKISPTIDKLLEDQSCLSGFFRENDASDSLKEYAFCNESTDNNIGWNWHTPINKYKYMRHYAHEYFHLYQKAHQLSTETGQYRQEIDPLGMPYWWAEGTAEIVPYWLMRDHFDDLSLTKELGLNYSDIALERNDDWDHAIGSGGGWPEKLYKETKRLIQEGSISSDSLKNCEYIGSAKGSSCNIMTMASYLMWITSPQVVLVDIPEDMWNLGFTGAFEKHAGMTMPQFYDELYEHFMIEDLESGPPDNFFMGPDALTEMVDFWSINSGSTLSQANSYSEDNLLAGKENIETMPDRFDFLTNYGQSEIVQATNKADVFTLEQGDGYKIIDDFDLAEDAIKFCGCPSTQLTTYSGDTYISKFYDLKAIVKDIDSSDLTMSGDLIVGV